MSTPTHRSAAAKRTRIGSLSVVTFLLAIGLQTPSLAQSRANGCEGVTREQVLARLNLIGATRQTDLGPVLPKRGSPTEMGPPRQVEQFTLNNGVSLDIIYAGQYLAEINVLPSGDLTETNYKILLDQIAPLKPLGDFIGDVGMAVTIHRGLLYLQYEFACACVGRAEHSSNHLPTLIEHFDVVYWVPLAGMVEAKRHADPAEGIPSECLVTIAGKEFPVSKADYDRLSQGQTVRAQLNKLYEYIRIVEIGNPGSKPKR
jgi:hypothetical protein